MEKETFKICPLLRDKCQGELCMWYFPHRKDCALCVIAKKLGDIDLTLTDMR